MTRKTILMFHQGAELYGSDYMFLMSVRSFSCDHDVHVVLDSTGPLVERLKGEGIRGLEILPLAVLRRSALRNPWRLLRYLVEFSRAALRIRRKLRQLKPDILYANTLGVLAPLVAAVGLGIRRVQHLHEIFDRPRVVFAILYTLGEGLSDDVLCVSEAVRQNLARMSRFGARKGRVVHNGIDRSTVVPAAAEALRAELRTAFSDPDLPLVAYVSRVHYWKGQREFLDVLSHLKNTLDAPVNTAFFGAPFADYPDMLSDLEHQAERMGLSGCVRFFGYRSDSHTLFGIADLSVMGSVEPDPFPTIVLESMVQGCPVVAFDHGGTPEMLNGHICGVVVPPRDTVAMATAIADLVADPALRSRLSANAQQEFETRFTLHHYSQRLKAVVLRP